MSKLPLRSLRTVLAADAGLTVLLVSLCAVLFVIYPFVPLSAGGRLLVTLGLTAILFPAASRSQIGRFCGS